MNIDPLAHARLPADYPVPAELIEARALATSAQSEVDDLTSAANRLAVDIDRAREVLADISRRYGAAPTAENKANRVAAQEHVTDLELQYEHALEIVGESRAVLETAKSELARVESLALAEYQRQQAAQDAETAQSLAREIADLAAAVPAKLNAAIRAQLSSETQAVLLDLLGVRHSVGQRRVA